MRRITLALLSLIAIIGSLIAPYSVKAVEWEDADWTYRKSITIAHTADGAQTDYQMKLLVGETSAYGNTGGTITTDGDYTIHTFLLADTGTKFVTCKEGIIDVLVVAGGGGGGSGQSGGGGAGGLVYSASYPVGTDSYTVTVGDGGAGGGAGNTDGVNGNNSVFGAVTATGGGSGAGYNGGGNQPGNNGGCGGGAAETGTASVGGTGSQGYNGGADNAGTASPYTGGGGGGMGAVGSTSRPSGGTSGGGNGLSTYSDLLIAANAGVDISGTHWVCGGGGGGGNTGQANNPGAGGNGGGGGGSCTGVGTAGTAGSGGGGGGGAYNAQAGGKGGSGLVIIRCLTASFSTDVDCEGHAAADFDDLRFTTSDGTTLCSYWIESVTGSTPDRVATVWIEVPTIAAHPDDTTIYMYYGHADAAAASDGATTFIVFDDFERGSNGDTVGGSWTEDVAHVHISTDQDMGNVAGYFGTRAMKLVGNTSTQPRASIPVTASNNIAINYRYYKEDLMGLVMQHGDGSGAYDASVWFSPAEDVQVWDGAGWVDSTVNCFKDVWGNIDIHKFNWTNGTMDITVAGATATGRDITYSSAGDDNVVRFYGDTTTDRDVWIDNFFVHNYTTNAPTWGSFGAEATLTYDISNTPNTKAFSVIAESTTYYAKGTAPNNPVVDGDCTYAITNSGNSAIDVSIHSHNFTGGVGWTIAANPGVNTVKLVAYKTDDNPASGVVLTTSGQSFITDLADGSHIHWDFSLTTGTFTDGVGKSTTITLTSTVH
jgi:hypothetical protein